jgi:hypothetical protein
MSRAVQGVEVKHQHRWHTPSGADGSITAVAALLERESGRDL